MHSGIYIHIPFCVSKCGYCDFFSITNLNIIDSFVYALKKEIQIYSSELNQNEIFDTIYIGGGTPSILPSGKISEILALIYSKFIVTEEAEITIEVNPGTVDQTKLSEYRNAGINRLSIGVQSFNDNDLKLLKRTHKANQSIEAVENAGKTGFETINIDLIYAIPNQKLETWEANLQCAIYLNPEHISAYNLTIEKDTPFYDLKSSGIIEPQSELKEKEFFESTNRLLTKTGYVHYEISSYSFGEKNISKHNYKYWKHNNYFGFGPSAHSFYNNKRWANYKSLDNYILDLEKNKKPLDFEELLSTKDLEFEHIFLSLRTGKGLDLKDFQNTFQLDFQKTYSSQIEKLIDLNFAVLDKTHFKLTNKGFLLYNEILATFIRN